jgi:DNA topoisomerase-1
LVKRKGRFGEFIACSAFPKCKYSKNLASKPKEEPKKIEVPCPECGGDIVLRSSRRGKFYGCSNYPKCTFISTYEPTKTLCPECGYNMAKRTFRGKDILECIKCKHRSEL